MIKAALLHQRREFSAEAARPRCLMHHHAPSGFPDRRFDGFHIQRQKAAQIDNFCIDAQIGDNGLHHMDHCAIT